MLFGLETLADNYLLWFPIFLVVVYYCMTFNYGFWSSKGIPYVKPVPLFGNALDTSLSRRAAFLVQQEIYNKYPDSPFIGTFEFFTPKLMLKDPALIEQVLIKDFSIFMDRRAPINPKVDPLGQHLVNLTGSKWKSLRNKLTPTFSSGKLKLMVEEIEKCADLFIEILKKKVKQNPGLEVRAQMAELTMYIIGSCAFGLNLDVLNNSDSTFMKIGRMAFGPSKLLKFRRFIRDNFPNLLVMFGWKGVPQEIEDFFVNTVRDTINHREESNVKRNDFIQLMMEIRKQEKDQKLDPSDAILDDMTFAANAFVFLLAGFETTASTLSFLLYELSRHPLMQDKLLSEVQNVMKKHKGEITWESVKEMAYLEQLISETLRLHSPVSGIQRISQKPYTIPKTSVELPKGTIVTIPIHSIHHDPQYFPEPEKFDPERFSEDNIHKIVKGTYLPFGDGPRICIGLRFAKLEVKVIMIKLISNFKLKLNDKSKQPLEFYASSLLRSPIGGLWVDFIPRE